MTWPRSTAKQSVETFKTNMPLIMLCGTALMAITGLTAFQTVV